jgi:lipoprotein-anchoring transpeptidase ErfK/SrfK
MMRLTISLTQFPSLLAIFLFGAVLVFPGGAQAENSHISQAESHNAEYLVGQPQPVYPDGPPQSRTDSGSGRDQSPGSASGAEEPKAGTATAKPESETAEPEATVEVEKPESETPEPEATVEVEKPEPTLLVNIDKLTQQMTVFVDGIEKHTWPVSTGLPGYSTPTGTYTPSSMNKMWYSRQWDNAPMPNSIFFTRRGHAIHGTHETIRLGRAASKGCVRLAPGNAATLFKLVKEHGMEKTRVVLNGPDPYGSSPRVASPAPQRAYPPRARGYNPWFERPEFYDRPRRRGLFGFRRAQPRAQRMPRFFQPRGPW